MSDTARWKRVKEIFDAVVASRVEDRAALVRDLCGDDRALQADVESLLASDAGMGSIFERSVDGALRGRVFERGRRRRRRPDRTHSRRESPSEPTK